MTEISLQSINNMRIIVYATICTIDRDTPGDKRLLRN